MRRSVIIGTGSYIPTRRIRNEDLVTREFFADYGKPIEREKNPRVVETFQKITDISERRYVDDDLVASDIGKIAGSARSRPRKSTPRAWTT